MSASVLVVTEDRVGKMLGGAAIRAYEIARSLTDVGDVTLAAPGSEPSGLAPARHVPFELDDPGPLRGLIEEADVVIMRPPNPVVASWLRASRARIVYDLCDPLPLDILEAQASSSRERQLLWHTVALDHFLAALHSGHHFICSGRRQRDMYVGALTHSAAEIGTILRGLADPAETPAVFHCHGGKDRTGLVAAVLLLALGVDRDTVLDDYEATSSYRRLDQQQDSLANMLQAGISPEAAAGVLGTPRWAMAEAVDRLLTSPGGVDAFLTGPGGLEPNELDALRDHLTAHEHTYSASNETP